MCCRLRCQPLVPEIAEAVLAIGLFQKSGFGQWKRDVPEEHGAVYAAFETMGDGVKTLTLSISPAVSSDEGHHGKRVLAGIYFEIAAKYAEKVDGRIVQQANIGRCIQDGVNQRVLAEYPDMPMDWSRICQGFQRELLPPEDL